MLRVLYLRNAPRAPMGDSARPKAPEVGAEKPAGAKAPEAKKRPSAAELRANHLATQEAFRSKLRAQRDAQAEVARLRQSIADAARIEADNEEGRAAARDALEMAYIRPEELRERSPLTPPTLEHDPRSALQRGLFQGGLRSNTPEQLAASAAEDRATAEDALRMEYIRPEELRERSPLTPPKLRELDPRDSFQNEPSMMVSADLLGETTFGNAEENPKSPFDLSQDRRKGARAFADLELPKNVPGRDREVAHQQMIAKFENMAKDTMAVLAQLQVRLDASPEGSADEAEIKRQAAALEQRLLNAREKQFLAEHTDPQATAAHYEKVRLRRTELLGDPNAVRVLEQVNKERGVNSWQEGQYIRTDIINKLKSEGDKTIAREWALLEREEAEKAAGMNLVAKHNEARVALTTAQVEALKDTTLEQIPAELKAALSDPTRGQASLEQLTDQVFAHLQDVPAKTTSEKVLDALLKMPPIIGKTSWISGIVKAFGRVHANAEVSRLMNSVATEKAAFDERNNARLSGRITPFTAELMGGSVPNDITSAAESASSTRQRRRDTGRPSSFSLENGPNQNEIAISPEQASDLQGITDEADRVLANLQGSYDGRMSENVTTTLLRDMKQRLEAYKGTPVATTRAYEVALDAYNATAEEAQNAVDNSDGAQEMSEVFPAKQGEALLSMDVPELKSLPKTEGQRLNLLSTARQGLNNLATYLDRAMAEGKNISVQQIMDFSDFVDAHDYNLNYLSKNGSPRDKAYLAAFNALGQVQDLLEAYGKKQAKEQRGGMAPTKDINTTTANLDTANWDLRAAVTNGDRLPSYQVRAIEDYLNDANATLHSLAEARALNNPEALNLAATMKRTRQLLEQNNQLNWE